MSHVAAGFVVTDIEALAKTVKEQCPELELVKQESFRTWAADHGRLVGDYPLPGTYQLKWLLHLIKAGVDVHKAAKEAGVELPQKLADLRKNSLSLEQQTSLLKNKQFKEAYEHITKNVVGKDAKYVIRYKDSCNKPQAYEIGLVPHPENPKRFDMVTDFYSQGNGLLNATGVGKHQSVDGVDQWGNELKQGYAINATEAEIQRQIAAGNKEYGGYQKTKLSDGRVKFTVTPQS